MSTGFLSGSTTMSVVTRPIRTDEERRQARETRDAEEAYARAANAPKN